MTQDIPMTDAELKTIPCHHCGAAVLASAPSPAGAVEPVAHIVERLDGSQRSVMLVEKYDPRKPEFWLNEDARAKHRVTPLYATPQAVAPTEVGEPVGFAYQDEQWVDEGRWHLCKTEPRSIKGRKVEPVYLAAALSAAPASAQPEGWQPITDEANPPLDTDVIMGWWSEWPTHQWVTELGHYGSMRGGWIHSAAQYWLPLDFLPAAPGDAS